MNETSQSLTLILAIHGQLYSRANIKTQGARETIEDSFQQMISLVDSEGSLSIRLSNLRQKSLEKKQTVQPFIYCIGEDIDDVEEKFLLIFDDYKYSFIFTPILIVCE